MIGKKVWKSLEFTNKNMTGVSTYHGFSCKTCNTPKIDQTQKSIEAQN